jgi:hypothetical protein
MLIPTLCHGTAVQVRKQMRPIIRRIVEGADAIQAIADGGLTDVTEVPTPIFLKEASGSETGIHVHTPWALLAIAMFDVRKATPPADRARAFHAALSEPWAVMGLLPYNSIIWLVDEASTRQLLAAILRNWATFDALGERYVSTFYPRRLWDIPTTLHYALAKLGVPQHLLQRPLPPGGVAELAKLVEVH